MITSRSEASCAEAAGLLGANVHYEAGHVGRDEDVDRVMRGALCAFGRTG